MSNVFILLQGIHVCMKVNFKHEKRYTQIVKTLFSRKNADVNAANILLEIIYKKITKFINQL